MEFSSFKRHGEILPKRSRVAPAMSSAFDACIDQCASSTCPNLSDNKCAVFAHDSTEMLNSRGCRGFADSFRRTARGQFAIAAIDFPYAQREKRIRSAVRNTFHQKSRDAA